MHKAIRLGISTQLNCFILLSQIGEMLWSYKKCKKVQVWKRLGRVITKFLLAQTIPDKVFGTKKRNPVNLDKKMKILYPILSDF